MSIAIIINPIAGGSARNADARTALAARVAAACREAAVVSVTEHPGHARTLARAALDRGDRLIVAWGGDGTVNEVATAVAFSGVPMGIVAGGSGNGLARELGLPLDAEPALYAAIQGGPRTIDVGEIDGRLFVNIAGLGFDAHVAAAFNRAANRRRGAQTYVALTARSLITYRPRRYAIATAGARLTVRALLIVIANGTEFGNRILIAPGARVDDGMLDVVVVEERSRAATVCCLPWLLTRSIHRVRAWSSRRVGAVTIEGDAPILFHVDGEPVQGGTTVRARIHAAALKVSVPGERR